MRTPAYHTKKIIHLCCKSQKSCENIGLPLSILRRKKNFKKVLKNKICYYHKKVCGYPGVSHLASYLVKKRIFCQNDTILWAIKVNKMPFFPDFLLKNSCSHTQFILVIRLFFKEETALKSMFCQKTFILSKTLCSHVIFFQVFFKKSPAVKPIFGKKTSVLSKLHYILGQKS